MFHGRLCYYRGMAKPSTVATHPQLKAITAALLTAEPLKPIAARFGVSPMALSRYRDKVIRPAIRGQIPNPQAGITTQMVSQSQQAVAAVGAEVRARPTLDRIEDKLDRYERMLDRAESEGDLHVWAKIAGVDLSGIKLRAQLRGELVERHVHDHQVAVLMPGLGEHVRHKIEDSESQTIDVQAEPEP